MSTASAALVRDLLAIVTDDVTPRPTATMLAALQAALARQVAAVGPVVAHAAVYRLAAQPGPVGIDVRRARFGGLAAVLASVR